MKIKCNRSESAAMTVLHNLWRKDDDDVCTAWDSPIYDILYDIKYDLDETLKDR